MPAMFDVYVEAAVALPFASDVTVTVAGVYVAPSYDVNITFTACAGASVCT